MAGAGDGHSSLFSPAQITGVDHTRLVDGQACGNLLGFLLPALVEVNVAPAADTFSRDTASVELRTTVTNEDYVTHR